MFYLHERTFGCRLNDEMTYRGLRILVLENDLLRVSVLLDKGADIYEFVYKPRDTDFLWRSPLGVRPAANNLNSRPSAIGPFLDYYEGGWQECLPNGGRVCTYKGNEQGLHGEAWGIPWHHEVLEDTPEQVSVRLWCRTPRSPYLLARTMTLHRGSPVLHLDEALTNEGYEALDFMWGHHPAFGPPFLDESCVLQCAAGRVCVDLSVGAESRLPAGAEFAWPVGTTKDGQPWDVSRVTPPDLRVSEMTYLTDLSAGWYALTNQSAQLGFGMAFDTDVFRHLWLWQSLGGDFGYPSWGRNYAMAVEPFSSFPAILSETMKAGRQLVIQPGETLRTWLRAVAYEGRDSVAGVDSGGAVT
jgi:galactose mutarotase-like enzyme